jgi:glycosyltransferase involved in cell wall biosynthesis
MNETFLTVCITTFNRWRSLLLTIESILQQQDVTIKIIVVDDCSTMIMPHEVSSLIKKNKNIKYIQHNKNMGLSVARNTAIRACSTELFSFCDDDDRWKPKTAFNLISTIKYSEFNNIGIVLPVKFKNYGKYYFDQKPTLRDVIKLGVTPPVAGQIYRSRMIKECGGYCEKIKSGVDHDLWVTLSKNNPNVSVVWADDIVVGSNPNAKRITTQKNKRRIEIMNSLEIWKDKIIDIYGIGFYEHFKSSYIEYLSLTFFMMSLRKGDIKSALIYLFENNVSTNFLKKIMNRNKFHVLKPYEHKGSISRLRKHELV